MANLVKPDQDAGYAGVPIGTPVSSARIAAPDVKVVLSSGSLRIGGDSPNGLVLSGGAPAARKVRLYDMETGELVAETISAADGTYAFTGLSARPEGYAVWIVGAAGERGYLIPGVHPGSP